jgi:hypothetical protein
MKNIFSRTFFFKANNITIKQANFFTTIFILLFTIIFVSVLIKENYEDYENTLHELKTFQNSKNIQKTSKAC